MLVTGFADMLDPRSWPVMTTAGYAFPLFALANLGMIVIWMFISKKHILVPFLGFVICYVPVMQYCPVHASGEVPLGALKIMTYNTWGFGSQREAGNDEEAKKEARRNILQYIADEDCHVVCIQEGVYHKAMEADIDSIIKTTKDPKDNSTLDKPMYVVYLKNSKYNWIGVDVKEFETLIKPYI